MSKISLHPYVISIRKKRSKIDEDVNNLFGTNTALVDIIKDVLLKYSKKPFLQEKSKKALKFENIPKITKIEDVNIIQSLVYYGEYGIIRKIMDTKTGEIDENLIDPEKTPVFDLIYTYFQDDLIKTKAYLISQTYSGNGYKTILTDLIRLELNAKFNSDVVVDINPLVSHDLVDIMKKEDRIIEIGFISHDVTKDDASKILSDNDHEIEIDNLRDVNLSLSSSKNKSLIPYDKIEEVTSNLKKMVLNSKQTAFYEITNSVANEIKVKVATPLNDFTVSINSNNLKFKESYSLDDDIVIGSDGRIAHDYIINEAKKYATSVADRYRNP